MVFFGGAGVSTESGIPDFRSEHGLYHAEQRYGYPPEVILSHDFFVRNPKVFYEYSRAELSCPGAMPNKAHRALAGLERMGKLAAVVTQNIDELHQAAGSRTVYELHGSTRRSYCMDCGRQHPEGYPDAPEKSRDGVVPLCTECGGIVRPDIVLYGEALDERVVAGATGAISRADVLIVGGTSLVVYPAAGMLRHFRGEHLVLINKQPTGYDDRAGLIFREPIGEVLSAAMELL